MALLNISGLGANVQSVVGDGVTIATMLQSLAANYQEFYLLVDGFCYTAGVWLAVAAIIQARAHAHHGESVLAMSGVNLLIGVILMSAPTLIGSLTSTLWGNGYVVGDSVMDYYCRDGCSPSSISTLKSVLYLVSFLGYIAFIRGWFMLRKIPHAGRGGQGDEFLYRGVAHIVGGVMAIHIWDSIVVIGHTFGINFEVTLGKFL